ncbi:MAG: alpha/beta fold hydrolase [Bacteroidota bacterium]
MGSPRGWAHPDQPKLHPTPNKPCIFRIPTHTARPPMKWLKNTFLALFILYCLACMALYLAQDAIIFYPHPLPESHQFRDGKEVEIELDDGLSLNCLWVKEAPSKGVILYLHGNRGNNCRCLYQAENLMGNGYDIFMPDYRGYGKSDGSIESEKQLFQDAEKVYSFLQGHYEESQIVVLGYSLGTGMASYLAAHHQPQQLILLAPYVSLVDMKNRKFPFVPDFLLKYPLNNGQHLQTVSCPVTLFHGTADSVIPFDSSETLQGIKPEQIQLIPLDRVSHRGLIFHRKVRREVGKLLL